MHVLVAIPTKDRYYDTLPLTIMSVANQTRSPQEIVVLDDSTNQIDVRKIPLYQHIFSVLGDKGIDFKWVYGHKKGQHHLHEHSQTLAKELIWRIDDDEVAEPNVLQTLISHLGDPKVGAVAGLVITPPTQRTVPSCYNEISKLNEPNCQWTDGWLGDKEVEHLYSSFLYRKDIAHYELSLSCVAHREETLFSHSIYRAGYKLIVDSSAKTWHFRNPSGGIRTQNDPSLWEHDEKIFQLRLKEWGVSGVPSKLVVLDNGIGDHIVFKKVLPDVKEKYGEVIISAAYPFVFEEEKLITKQQAEQMIDISMFDIYKWMWEHNWKGNVEGAYRELYNVKDTHSKNQ